MRPRVLVPCLLALVAAGLVGLSLASRTRPPSGLVEGTLRACPPAPNGVSSQAADAQHVVPPLLVVGDPHQAFARAVSVVDGWPRSELLVLEERYAHFEITSAWLRLRDDLELLLDEGGGRIHVRSSARVGQTDFGANRSRVERLRAALEGR